MLGRGHEIHQQTVQRPCNIHRIHMYRVLLQAGGSRLKGNGVAAAPAATPAAGVARPAPEPPPALLLGGEKNSGLARSSAGARIEWT